MKTRNFLITTVIILFSFVFVQCTDDDDDMKSTAKGQFSLKITDAPSDDANIKGTFITVSEVKVDGEKVEGFSKQTIEISAYQKGNAKLLISEDIEATEYNSVSLVLDYESNENNDGPGCYVESTDNEKHNLDASSSSKGEITFSNNFTVEENSQSNLVIDFDLRKSIVNDNERAESDYKFVTSAEMRNAIRIVDEDNTGEVSGNVSTTLNTDDETFIYIYKKGEFSASSENTGQGSSDVLFAKAVTSSKVESDGSYQLSFLEEGDYEVHLASYERESNGKLTFKGMLEASSIINGMLLNNVSVSSSATVSLDISILGLL